MGDQRNEDKQNPGFTDEEKKREKERADYQKIRRPILSGRRSKTRNMIRATSKTIPIVRPLDKSLCLRPRQATGGVSSSAR